MSRTLFLNACLSLRHITAASILAGESSLGSDNIEITDTMMDSTPRIGRHRSIADSYAIPETTVDVGYKNCGWTEGTKVSFVLHVR